MVSSIVAVIVIAAGIFSFFWSFPKERKKQVKAIKWFLVFVSIVSLGVLTRNFLNWLTEKKLTGLWTDKYSRLDNIYFLENGFLARSRKDTTIVFDNKMYDRYEVVRNIDFEKFVVFFNRRETWRDTFKLEIESDSIILIQNTKFIRCKEDL